MFRETVVLGTITFESCIPGIESFMIIQDTVFFFNNYFYISRDETAHFGESWINQKVEQSTWYIIIFP